MSMFTLISSSGEVYPIEGEIIFGRGTQCTIQLDDHEVSRKHATIYEASGNLMVRDEGSANGTFVNDGRVEGATSVTAGDEIRLGKTVLTVKVTPTEDLALTALSPEPSPMAAQPGRSQAASPEPARAVLSPAASPESEVIERTQISEEAPVPKKKSQLPILGIGCGLLFIIAICGIGAIFLISSMGILDGIGTSSGAAPDLTYSLEEVLQEETIDDRPEVVSYLGLPDAFTISEIILEGVPVRVETWRYFAFEMRVDFVDGEATWTIDIEPAPEDSILPAWYDPLAFELGMSPSEAALVATSASQAAMTPEVIDLSEGGEDLSGATMMVGDQILIGLDESGLVYVETIALFPAEEGGS